MRSADTTSAAAAAASSSSSLPLRSLSVLLLAGVALGQPAAGGAPVMEDFSFRAPFKEINPYTGARQIDKWDLGGTASVHRSFLRLTSESQGNKGYINSQTPFTATEWSAMLELRASGQSPHLYGDGLAIWLVKSAHHVEGPVFGREDKWTGLGVFFDTFQNVDHSHHHKHPYIYAMVNDGTKGYIPDAETTGDVSKQALPGQHENSGCSYEFRYAENREDVTVLNHTRVHMTYTKDRILKLRLQQTSQGVAKEWFNCIDMKDVDVPNPGYWGVSSATGDLVDNHDIIQFVVRSGAGVTDHDADYEAWANGEAQAAKSKLEEFDLRPPEALQRDYQRALRAQAEAIKTLSSDVEQLKQQLEFQLSSMSTGISATRKSLDDKSEQFDGVTRQVQAQDELHSTVKQQDRTIADLKRAVQNAGSGGGWKFPSSSSL